MLTDTDRDRLAEMVSYARTLSDNETDVSTRPTFGTDAPVEKSNFNINFFPRGDVDKFSVSRYVYAQSKMAQDGLNPHKTFLDIAPYEYQYIEKGRETSWINPITKANMGDMVSGQDGRSCRL